MSVVPRAVNGGCECVLVTLRRASAEGVRDGVLTGIKNP
jgi:hypothetical protein